MGLDATVMCTCWAERRIPAPPFADLLLLSEDGYLTLAVPYEGNEALHAELDRWISTACEHPEMEAADEWIGNWSGYRSFQAALGEAGWEHFPVLRRQLPATNGGQTPAEEARRMLGELELFSGWGSFGERHVLLDADTGESIAESIAAYEGVFVMSGFDGLEIGLDERGCFVRRRRGHAESREEVFRSTDFTQELLEPERTEAHEHGRVRFVDRVTGVALECRTSISGGAIPWPDGRMTNDQGKARFRHPARMYTARGERRPDDHREVIAALRRVCLASAETGNPIRWL